LKDLYAQSGTSGKRENALSILAKKVPAKEGREEEGLAAMKKGLPTATLLRLAYAHGERKKTNALLANLLGKRRSAKTQEQEKKVPGGKGDATVERESLRNRGGGGKSFFFSGGR